ncbi:hypothetical protein MPNT_10397 [Candidatus Methylacidithermus pantelleriae]|uniref:Uncharacterized protein n=1 Tax=Candidatus Methylacidithermus pantelleriae TaxID=2744239 RepID=A0A8J2BMN3_9BACT|nr:hypothetical protein MPNT_10397 [Candidatus Methylacidithermus pantelleriae]
MHGPSGRVFVTRRLADVEKEERLPVPTEEVPIETVTVRVEAVPPDGVALCPGMCKRRSNSGLRETMRLGSPSWVASKKLRNVTAGKEVGSGMNDHRRGVVREVCDPKARVILVE